MTAFLNLENLTDTWMTRWQALVRPCYSPAGAWTTDAWAPLEGGMINGGVRVRFSRGYRGRFVRTVPAA